MEREKMSRAGSIPELIFLLLVISLFCQAGWGQPWDGNGVEGDPYLIYTAEDMQAIGADPNYWDAHFLLCDDIDMSGLSYTTALIAPDTNNSSTNFQGTPFTGTFDGNDFNINNLTICAEAAGNDYVGLFGQIGENGQVKNLGIEDVNITGGISSWWLGVLCGCNYHGTISNSHATGSVIAGNNSEIIGGLCGYNYYGTISKCYANVSVAGDDRIGGLCGTNEEGIISNCWALGIIIGDGKLGGLCGRNCWSGTISNSFANGFVVGNGRLGVLCGENDFGMISNCYAAGSVSGDSYIGGLCGYNESGPISNCYFLDPDDGGGPDNGLGTPLTDDQMKQQNSFVGWDFINESDNGTHQFWKMLPDSYPVLSYFDGYMPPELAGSGSVEDPWLIHDANELGAVFYYDPSGYYRLQDDLNLDNIIWSIAPIPVLIGHFDGSGFKIENLTISGGSFLGLIGRIYASGTVMNLCLENANITGEKYSMCIGGLCGQNKGTLDNCVAKVNIISVDISDYLGGLCGKNYGNIINSNTTSSISAGSYSDHLGGLCGWNLYGTISYCYTTGSVTGSDNSWYIGGLCGSATGGMVSNSYANVTVEGDDYLGGLCGWAGDHGIISNCYAIGSVNGGGNSCFLGGLCGRNYSDIINCYATGSVSAGILAECLGGLCGQTGASIKNSYATGTVSAVDDSKELGGFCGRNWLGTLRNCYATGYVTGGNNSEEIGGFCGRNWDGSILNSYATGAVSGSSELGGFCGYNSTGVFSSCYFLDPDDGGGPDNGISTPLTDDLMKQQNSFVGWDFVGEIVNGTEDIWRMCVDDVNYPMLWWEFLPGDFLCPDGVNMKDFAILALAWESTSGETGWNPVCDISDPNDNIINEKDLAVFCENWLEGI